MKNEDKLFHAGAPAPGQHFKNLPIAATLWRIAIKPVDIKDTSDGGIALVTETVKAKEYLRYVGQVVSMGPLCYRKSDFRYHPNSEQEPMPACKLGDYVVFGRHSGQEVLAEKDGRIERYRMINDDEVLAVVSDINSININI